MKLLTAVFMILSLWVTIIANGYKHENETLREEKTMLLIERNMYLQSFQKANSKIKAMQDSINLRCICR